MMKKFKNIIKVLSLTVALSVSMSMVSMAAQSDRWTENNGTWYLKNEQNTGNVVNSWFQDLDGSWYLLAPGDGHMYAGLIHDTLTDRWYFCQTEHDGWYGRMAHVNGTYTVNGNQVNLTFEQEHNGYFGAITSGLDSLKGTGIEVKDVNGIPTESESINKTEKTVENSNSTGSLSENDRQYDVNGDGILDERELANKDFLENYDGFNIGQDVAREWR